MPLHSALNRSQRPEPLYHLFRLLAIPIDRLQYPVPFHNTHVQPQVAEQQEAPRYQERARVEWVGALNESRVLVMSERNDRGRRRLVDKGVSAKDHNMMSRDVPNDTQT